MVTENDVFNDIIQIDAEQKQKEVTEQPIVAEVIAPVVENTAPVVTETTETIVDNTETTTTVTTEAPAAPVVGTETWEQMLLKKNEEDAKQKEAERKEALLNHPTVKLAIESVENNIDFKELTSRINQANPKDFDNKTILATTLDKGASEADLDEAERVFNELPESTQKFVIENQRKILQEEYDNTQKSLKNNDLETYKQASLEALDTLKVSVDEKIVGKEHEGVNITHAMATEIFLKAKQLFNSNRVGAKIDVETALNDAVTLITAPFIKAQAEERGRQQQAKVAIKEFHNIQGKSNVNGNAQVVNKTQEEKNVDAVEAYTEQFTIGIKK